jgi:hypothetical protein
VSVLLNGGPALLVLEISTGVPELNVDLTEIGDTWGRVSFEIDDSIISDYPKVSYLQPIVGR